MIWVPLVICWLGLLVLWIAMIVDASRTPVEAYEEVGRSRLVTVALLVLTGWFGAIYYALTIRPKLARAERGLRRAATPKPVTAGTKYCLDCDLSSIADDAIRCKNCGSERLASLADRKA